MKHYKYIFLLNIKLFLSLSICLSNDTSLIFEERIYDKNIHTVLCHQQDNQLTAPIINLNSEEKLELHFDDFSHELYDYYYTIIHCDSEWKKSDLLQSEYINGFFENRIENYKFSFNTLQKYTHYSLTFPEDLLIPKLSGNYIIQVFRENNPENIVFTKKFMILEEKVNIIPNIKRATLIEDRNFKQEVDFTISHENLYISNPYSDIKVIVKQNNRDDNSIKSLKPLFIKEDHLIYDYQDDNVFYANNEFRYFDIQSIRYLSEKIKDIKFLSIDSIHTGNIDSSYIEAELYTDISRSFNEYITISDLNGDYLINKQEAWDSDIEGEYVNIKFSLLENRITYGDIYIIGKFTNWILSEENKLIFNKKNRRYELSMLLKQGYYNYLYVVKDNNSNQINTSFIEGSHYECRNEYYIYVYYTDIMNNYDQLIGYIKTSSKPLF